MANTVISYAEDLDSLLDGAEALYCVGSVASLKGVSLPEPLAEAAGVLCEGLSGSAFKPSPASTAILGSTCSIKRLVLVPLAESVSRYVSPAQSYPTTDGLTAAGLAGATGTVAVLLLVEKPEFALAAAMGTARALPAYSRKTSDSGPVAVKVLIKGATPNFLVLGQEMASSLRRAQALADAPAEEVNTSQFESAAITAVGDVSGVSITSIVGEELLENGLNAIYTVGRAGVDPPRMVVLEYTPPHPVGPPLGLVGKGIVFDSGGLNLKTSPSYMKGDMGGAAAVLGAFESIVKTVETTGFSSHLYAVVCLAENAIGPEAYRPDDMYTCKNTPFLPLHSFGITMHSGLTVEVANTDAEGRFLLSDGLSWLAREKGVKWLVDAATLTGHSVGTGKAHAGVVSNAASLEHLAVQAGLVSGDHVMPMIFAPEILGPGFSSPLADLKNTGATDQGAGSAAAGIFIYRHIEDVEDVEWLHCDLAGPALGYPPGSPRMTGYGVGLLSTMVLMQANASKLAFSGDGAKL